MVVLGDGDAAFDAAVGSVHPPMHAAYGESVPGNNEQTAILSGKVAPLMESTRQAEIILTNSQTKKYMELCRQIGLRWLHHRCVGVTLPSAQASAVAHERS